MDFSGEHITICGDLSKCPALTNRLTSHNIVATVLPQMIENEINGKLLVILTDPVQLNGLREIKIPWMAWCMGSANLIAKAYEAGASAVFPKELDVEIILNLISRLPGKGSIKGQNPSPSGEVKQRRYQRGDVILLESDIVLEVVNGIIAQTMVYQDGTEVLMGLFGPKNLVIPHPADKCFIQLVAHTDVTVLIKTWSTASSEGNFCERLRCRLQQMEAWASMQARPNLQQRVLGILSLLSEQFGETIPQGRLLNIRFTHAQLASAVGATRATITRTLGDLKRQDSLIVLATADGERFCLPHWEQGSHLSLHQSKG